MVSRIKKRRNKIQNFFTFTFFIGVFMIAFVAFPQFRDYWNESSIMNYSFGNYDSIEHVGIREKYIVIGETVINIETAVTKQERVQGLSGRESLEPGSGMLFIFEKDGKHSMWMKDMNFPIDILWLDRNQKIIHIEENVSPETYPRTFSSNSRYVLELPAGTVQEKGIKIMDQVEFF